MKKALTLILLCGFFGSIDGQNIKAHFTHEVEYVISSRNSADTLTIAFDKSGRYLWTSYNAIVKKLLAKKMFRDLNIKNKEFRSNIIFDSENIKIYIDISVGDHQFFFALNLLDIIPMGSSDGTDEEFELNSVKTDSTFLLQNKSYPKYKIIPNNEPNKSIIASFDESADINTSRILQRIIALIIEKTESTDSYTLNIPPGLILYIQDNKGKDILRATKSTKINKTLNHNYNFKITE